MFEGWIKLHRSILDDELYLAEKFTKLQAWLDLLLLAEYKPKTVYVRSIRVDVGRGQVAISIRDLAERWKWGVNRVQSFLKELVNTGKIQIIKSHTINVIAICKYEVYQRSGGDTQTDTQVDTQIDTQNDIKTDTRGTPINKGKTEDLWRDVNTQNNNETDTQTDTQVHGESDTQQKEKVTKKKYIEEIKETNSGGAASAIAPATTPQEVLPKKRKTKEEIKAETEIRRKSFGKSLIPYVDVYGKQMIRAFYDYWSELNKSGTKMKWELERTWELDRRLSTWERKDSEYNGKTNGARQKVSSRSDAESVLAGQSAAVINDIAKADEYYYNGGE